MSVESQFQGLRWNKNPTGLIELYKKQKPVLEQLKIRLKQIDGELEHEIAMLEENIAVKITVIQQNNIDSGGVVKETGSYALIELEENITCLEVLLEAIKAGVDDMVKIQKGICLKQSLKRIDYSLDQLLLFMNAPFKSLTSREQEVLINLAAGLSNEEIASKLYISIKTVKNHVSSIYRKTGYRERAKLVLAARNKLDRS